MKKMLIAGLIGASLSLPAFSAQEDSRILATQQAQIQTVTAQLKVLTDKVTDLSKTLEAQKVTNQQLLSLLNAKADAKASGNNCLATSNGYQLCMQTDGNLVVYNPNGTHGWNTLENDAALNSKASISALNSKVDKGTSCMPGGDYTVCMQADGNLVVYKAGLAYWSIFTGKIR